MDQGSTRKRSAVHNFAPTVTKFCVMWEGQALPHDTKFGNSRCEIVGRRVIFIWSLIHGSSWSGLIKVGPDDLCSAVIDNYGYYYTPAPPKVERGYTGFTLMSVRPSVRPSVRLSVRLSVRPSVRLSVCRQGFRNFSRKLLAQFISSLGFILMG